MAEEKTILTVDLYDNVLTEKTGDFTGKIRITGTTRTSDISNRIVKKRTEYRPETITNILDLSYENKITVMFTPSATLLKALENIYVNADVATVGPMIESLTDSTTGEKNLHITPNAPAIIFGSTLLIKGDHPSVGVYFTKDEEGATPTKVLLIVRNTTSEIIIQIPQLAEGQYWLSVTTQAGAGYSLVKDPRTYKVPILLTVGAGGGGDSESPDEI